jgi:serine/threonine protein kinase
MVSSAGVLVVEVVEMQSRYTFVKQLPSGGFGNVAVLFDNQLKREVVVKTLIDPSPENRERFAREARILNALIDNEFVVDILDANTYAANPYIILEYCKHGSLQSWVDKRPLLGHNDVTVAHVIQHAAMGLHAIHKLGGVHRDIKPANLFLGEIKQAELRIKVGDFGVGRVPFPHTGGNVTRHIFGTKGYIAPEAYKAGAVFTQPCDIYSLGITGIELVTGSRDPKSINNTWFVNGELKHLLIRMTSQNPADRPSALQVAQSVPAVEKKQEENTKAALWGMAGLAVLGLFSGGGGGDS